METAACLPFCTATRGLTWRQVFTLRFPLALELVRRTPTAATEAPGSDRTDSYFSAKHSYRVDRPVKSRECQIASRQHECSLQNGKARLVPAGPRFHGHTQHTPLWFLTSLKHTGSPVFLPLNQLLEVGCSASSELPQPRNAAAAPLGLWLSKSLQCHRKSRT